MTDSMNYSAIPQQLRDRSQWLLFDRDADTPRRPHWDGDFSVSWSAPKAWHSFDEATAKASEKDSWGVGYVCAAANDDHPMGVMSVIDIDGGATPDDSPKDWLPGLQPFGDHDAYLEWSASHDEPGDSGIHIPIAGTPPEWWRDIQLDDGEHEGVDVLSNKFCVFTGDEMDGISGGEIPTWDEWADKWLADAYEALTGETAPPRRSGGHDDGGELDAAESRADDGLEVEEAREALDHINADCAYETWRNIGFALADEFPERTAQRLFEQWSRGTSKYDDEAEKLIQDISSRGTGKVTIGTLIHHATQAGWQPSGKEPQVLDAAAEADEEPPDHAPKAPEAETGTDGGTVAESADSTAGPRSLDDRIRAAITAAENDDIQQKTARHRIARAIQEEHHFVYPEEQVPGWRTVLYVYNDDAGIYEPRGAAFVERLLERHAGDYVTNQVRNEIVGKIERMSKTDESLQASPERLVVGNGILDLHTGELEAFDPGEYHTTKLDVDWRPAAGEPDAIDEFLHDIVEDDDVMTLYRLIAHTLYKEYLGEKAAILIGSGSNGKSMFLSLIEEFVGSYNVAHRELQDFDDDGFAANNLQGKLANLATEIGEQEIQNATTFKKLTGRDSIQARVKFEKPIKFENYASLLFATNEMPVFGQDNHAIWRRWLYVDFPYTFDADDPAAKDPEPERVLKDRLFCEEELQALLVRCQKEIQRWYEGRPFYDDAMDADAVRDKMKKAAEPVYAFGSTCLTSGDADEDVFVEKSVVRAAYKAYAGEEDLPRISENEFGKRLLGLRDFNIESTRKRVDGSKPRVYEGIQLSKRGRQVLGIDEPESDDDQQTVNDDRPAAKPTVMEQARQLVEDNDGKPIPREGLVWACAGQIGKATAENAVDNLLTQGRLYETGNGDLLPT